MLYCVQGKCSKYFNNRKDQRNGLLDGGRNIFQCCIPYITYFKCFECFKIKFPSLVGVSVHISILQEKRKTFFHVQNIYRFNNFLTWQIPFLMMYSYVNI